MIDTFIIDDEPDAREVLKTVLDVHFPKLNVSAQADSVASGIELLQSRQPDLLFLDIKLADGTAFDMLKALDKVNFEIVFTTGHDSYAIRAFEFSAYAYLLKPVRISELRKVIGRLEKHLLHPDSTDGTRMKVLTESYGSQAGTVRKLILEDHSGFEVVLLKDIIFIHGEGNYSTFHLANGKKKIVSKTLKEYENLLEPHGFFRSHKSFLVNLNQVQSYNRHEGMVDLAGGHQLSVSRRRRQQFITRFA